MSYKGKVNMETSTNTTEALTDRTINSDEQNQLLSGNVKNVLVNEETSKKIN